MDAPSSGVVKSDDAPGSPAPDWDLVPFDVGCARCGQDLRGLTEPVCPACELEFDWATAVPIEELTCRECDYHLFGLKDARCPECGTEFTWSEVLVDYHRRRKPLFEYRWRSQPIRSLGASWGLALRPWTLWRKVDLHDPPAVKPLAALAAIAAVVFALIVPGIALATASGLARLSELIAASGGISPGSLWAPELTLALPWVCFTEEHAAIVAHFGVWIAASFAALLVFQQSMAHCRVRTAHVFRVCVYALLAVPVGETLLILLMFTIDLGGTIFGWRWPMWLSIVLSCVMLAVVLSTFLWVFMSIALGYRLYLRMSHAWYVAFAAQIIAGLVLAISLALRVTLGF